MTSAPDPTHGERRALRVLLVANDFQLAILADDPLPVSLGTPLPVLTLRVPPITMGEARDARPRAEARAELGLPASERIVLVAAGGGGDADALARAVAIAQAVVRVAPGTVAVLALGPLAPPPDLVHTGAPPGLVRVLRIAPLQPLLAAFDGAFSPAGYNTAHELAKAGVPAALFAQPRPYDDQAARAARFAEASLAHALAGNDDPSIAAALSWMATALLPAIEAGAADRAADSLLDLATGRAIAR